jgi:hypothetical protein
MLHFSPKSFLKSSSRLGDPWMDMRGWLLVFRLKLLCLHLADSPPGRSGQFARPCVRPVRCLFLRARGSIRRGSWFWLHGVCGQPACLSRTVRAVRVALWRSAGRAQTFCFSRCSTGSSGGIFGRSALCLRMVRLAPADSPLPPRGRSCGHSPPSCHLIGPSTSPTWRRRLVGLGTRHGATALAAATTSFRWACRPWRSPFRELDQEARSSGTAGSAA